MDEKLLVLVVPDWADGDNLKLMRLDEERAATLAERFPHIIHSVVTLSTDI